MTDTDGSRFANLELDFDDLSPAAKVPEQPKFEAPAPASVPEQPLFGLEAPAPAWPFPAPPASWRPLTASGQPMSPRAARLYGTLNARGLIFGTMSTDEHVRGHLPQLRALLAEVEAFQFPAAESHGALGAELRDLRDDLRALMSRVPENRSTGVTSGPVSAQASQEVSTATTVEPGRVLAVAEHSETTGAVVFWNGSSGATVEAYEAACDAEGIDERLRQAAPSREVAFGRACRAEESKSVDVVASKARATWVRVQRGLTEDGAVVLGAQVRLRLTDTDEVEISKRDSDAWKPADGERTAQLRDRLAAQFLAARSTLLAGDITDWLVSLVEGLGGVPLRGRGGVYFVPRDGVATYQAAMRVVSRVGAGAAYEIPALRAGATVEAVTAALAAEVDKAALDIEGEIAAVIGLRAAKNRQTEVEALVKKIGEYETLFGVRLDAARARLEKVSKALAEVSTRTAQLEVD